MSKQSDLQLVQMRVPKRTMETLDKLKESMHEENRSKIIRDSLELTNILVSAIKSGGRVVVEEKNGERFKVVIPGTSDRW